MRCGYLWNYSSCERLQDSRIPSAPLIKGDHAKELVSSAGEDLECRTNLAFVAVPPHISTPQASGQLAPAFCWAERSIRS